MGIWKSPEGSIHVELTCADPTGMLSILAQNGLILENIAHTGELTLRFRIGRTQFRKLRRLCSRRGGELTILHRQGSYWTGKRLLGRPILLGMGLLVVMATLYLPGRVLTIRVEGNRLVPTRRILDAAEQSDLGFWTARRGIRSEQVKNQLLERIPELQWAGVNTAGCEAVIHVRERTAQSLPAGKAGVCNVAAARDGVITQVTVLAGNGLCQPGQAVREGQLLVSGYTDCGLTVRAERAEAEVYALTRREFSAVFPAQWLKKRGETGLTKKYSLVVGKKRINFGKNSGILGGTCGKMTRVYQLTLPGGIRLPVSLWEECFQSVDTLPETVTEEEAQTRLTAFAQESVEHSMIAGEILGQEVELETLDGAYRLSGHFTCREMIARQINGEILETNGKTD